MCTFAPLHTIPVTFTQLSASTQLFFKQEQISHKSIFLFAPTAECGSDTTIILACTNFRKVSECVDPALET
jgi:hypothetical protein